MTRHHRHLLSVLVGLAGILARAADIHVTPVGAGVRDGRGWDSALDPAALAGGRLGRLSPGDRLLLGGGVYTNLCLTLSASGAPGRPIRIEGVDRGAGLPVFASDWTLEKPARGNTAISLAAGVSHLECRGLRIRGYRMGVRAEPAPGGGTRAHLVFEDVDIQRMRHGFHLSDCDDLKVEGCDLTRYSKHGFRFDQGCDRVELRECRADCSEGDAAWEDRTELFPFGFLLDCLISETPTSYQRTSRGGDLVLNGSVVVAPGGNAGDPRYAQPKSTWDGVGPAMDSGAYPDKGYRAALEE